MSETICPFCAGADATKESTYNLTSHVIEHLEQSTSTKFILMTENEFNAAVSQPYIRMLDLLTQKTNLDPAFVKKLIQEASGIPIREEHVVMKQAENTEPTQINISSKLKELGLTVEEA